MPRAFTETQSARVRERLLEVGRRHMARTGLRKVTVAALAREAGISKGGFYLFFASKEALWVQLVQEAETELRTTLMNHVEDETTNAQACVRAVVTTIMDAVVHSPMLRALSDPDEMAWLMRSLPAEVFAEAQADDVRFYRRLHRRLRGRGVLGRGATPAVLVGLPSAALALAQGQRWFCDGSFEPFSAFTIDAWVARLTAD